MAKRDGTVDLRIKRTQKSIKNAFYELIEEKGFDHISVKDITERAMISRNTFYLHYNDKFDLLNKVCDELVFKLFIGVGKQLRRETRKLRVDIYGAASVIKMGIKTIEEDREAYRVLLSSSGSDLLTQKLQQGIRRALDLISSDIEGISEYSLQYIISGTCGIIKYQVTHESSNIETRRIALLKFILAGLLRLCRNQRETERAIEQ
jgi:AcrR family transcriptional regulator